MKTYSFNQLVIDKRTGLNPRRNFKLGSGENHYVTIKEIHDGKIIITDKTEKIDDAALELIQKRSKIKKGDILFASIGRIGETAIVENDPKNWNVNESVFVFTVDQTKVLPAFFCFLLASPKNAEILKDKSTGSTFRSIKMGQLEKLSFDIPPIDEQTKIILALSGINDAIAKVQNAIFESDELIKSRFVKMFGDETKFPKEPLASNVSQMFIGPFGSDLKNDCFVPKEQGFCIVYEQRNAIKKTIDEPNRYVREDKYRKMIRFSVLPGDIIVSCRGTVGETYVIPEKAPLGIMHPSIMKIRVKKDKYLPKFFDGLLQLFFKDHSDNNGSGVKMAITATALGKESFIVPPLNVQKDFCSFEDKIYKLEKEMQREKDLLNELLSLKMHQYFD
jgi:type I restriction enzyme, S subunit